MTKTLKLQITKLKPIQPLTTQQISKQTQSLIQPITQQTLKTKLKQTLLPTLKQIKKVHLV
ncbi:hypothetical protein ACWXVL_01240 [Mycoplasma sp. 128]